MTEKDDYLEQIEDKKIGSSLLRRLTAPTLKNSSLVDVINGFPVVRVPEDKVVIVHSACGDSEILDPERHTKSMVNNLVFQARTAGVSPVAFLNVVDASEGKASDIEVIGKALRASADYYGFSVLDGEDALLGPDRVKAVANVSGTMISLGSRKRFEKGCFRKDNISFAIFDPRGKLVRGCADGTGTKPDFYARAAEVIAVPEERIVLAGFDEAAMVLDDYVKADGDAMVVSAVFEHNRESYGYRNVERIAMLVERRLDVLVSLHPEFVGNRLCGHRDGMFAYNISGAAVGVADEGRLRNPPKPSAGEYLVAISGVMNMRSNGARDKRKAMIKAFGEEWHKDLNRSVEVEGRRYIVGDFLAYLTTPSIVLYPVFKELFELGLASSVYHMSGGAYKDKLARPLAQHGLFAEVMNLFPPSFADIFFAQQLGNSLETCYKKWPMGNDGFVTTSEPDMVIEVLKKYGLNGRRVGRLEEAVGERTGVELANVMGSDGKPVYFSGRD